MFSMEDIPIRPEVEMRWLKAEIAELKEELAKQRRKVSAPTTRKRKAPAKHHVARPVKRLPPMQTPEEQPRDRFGRFARKTATMLKGALFGTASVIGGTVAAAQSGHKTVKKVLRKKRANGKGGLVKRKRVVRGRKRYMEISSLINLFVISVPFCTALRLCCIFTALF